MNLTMGKTPKDPKSKNPAPGPPPVPDPEATSRRLLGLPNKVWALLEELAAKRITDVSEELRAAVRERLERYKMWPPSGGGNE